MTPKQAQIAARTARIQQLAAALNISTDGATELLLSRRPVTALPVRSREQVEAALHQTRQAIEALAPVLPAQGDARGGR